MFFLHFLQYSFVASLLDHDLWAMGTAK